jgi:lipopolysaccharide/colanic/teichoic acid biosynthesis glycosyltransferase
MPGICNAASAEQLPASFIGKTAGAGVCHISASPSNNCIRPGHPARKAGGAGVILDRRLCLERLSKQNQLHQGHIFEQELLPVMGVPSPTSRRKRRFDVSIWDALLAFASPVLALWLGDALVLTRQDWNATLIYWGLSSGFAVVAFLAFGLRNTVTRHFSAHEALDVAEAVLFAELLTYGFLFTLTRLDGIPRSVPLYHGLLLAGGLVLIRIVTRGGRDERCAPGYQSRHERIIVIGANRLATSFISMLRAYAPHREGVVAILDEKSSAVGRALGGVHILGTPQELDAIVGEFAVHGVHIDRVIFAGDTDLLSSAALHDVERVCKKRHLELSYLPRMLGLTERGESSLPAVVATEAGPEHHFFLRLKRCIDVVGSLALMVFLLPLFAAATMLVLIDVGSPVLFWQERTGRRGVPFLIYKYRTLRAPFDSKGKPTFGDRQPSAIGRFLRATRIDELPQLINVLFGDMSLVGPRPLLPEDQPDNTALRLSVRPGITGWAQVNGAKLVSREDKERFDEWYIRNASPWVDTQIALMTIRTLTRSYVGSTESAADLAQVEARRSSTVDSAPAVKTEAVERPAVHADAIKRTASRG